MACVAENPSSKLRLLRRVPSKNDSVAYDCTAMRQNRTRVRSTPPLPGCKSDATDNAVNRPPVPVPNRRPSRQLQTPPLEGNADTGARYARQRNDPPVPTSQGQQPQSRRPAPAGQRRALSTDASAPRRSANATEIEMDRPAQNATPRQNHTSAQTAGFGKPAPGPPRASKTNLENDALLIDAVPSKWPVSRHHTAELLSDAGYTTVGEFRRYVEEVPFQKIVNAVLAADAACASPGCIRNRSEAQKCVEEFVRLVKQDGPSAPAQRSAPQAVREAPVGSRPPPYATGMDEALLSQGPTDSPSRGSTASGKSGCPRCGRDFSGRALVMHLKTCRPSGSQTKRAADPFAAAPDSRDATPQRRTQPSVPPGQTAGPPNSMYDELPVRSTQHAGTNPLGPQPNEFSSELEAASTERQMPCPHCGRTFRESVLQRHAANCQKINKPRKQFNALKQALPEEAVKIHKQAERQAKAAPKKKQERAIQPSSAMPRWKAKSEAFRNAIKCARTGQAAPAAPPELDDRIQCQHCGRRFGQQQAERHIPICPKGRGKGRR